MPLAKRIIPCLDVDAGRVVKGVKFVDIRDAGDPVEIAKRYNDEGARSSSGAVPTDGAGAVNGGGFVHRRDSLLVIPDI